MEVETSASAATARRVRFQGAEYIEYDMEQAPVVHYCGVGRRTELAATTEAAMRMEWEARGRPSSEFTVQALESLYLKELEERVRIYGIAPVTQLGLAALRAQLELVEVLATELVVQDVMETDVPCKLDTDARRALQLAKKEVPGYSADGYVFGRRFYSVDDFLDLFEVDELKEIADNYACEVPKLTGAEKAKVKVTESELVAVHPAILGKPLKMLTLREMVAEGHLRGVDVKEVLAAGKGKKGKKKWLSVLRPLMQKQLLQAKWEEVHREMVKKALTGQVEKCAAEQQQQQLLELISLHLQRAGVAWEAPATGNLEDRLSIAFMALFGHLHPEFPTKQLKVM
ncbi:TPA: hypothetical protein N0F65_003611 [Lagenidium giganteum]|uniref:Uncharacterized protein n=1 Tax=Lagenidium giganteum TaxID=4803 RepID=A0AAV2Z1Y4_9STRA|nr:TPA: hypothetical protein N0F65_003611 [Lagenidium giganteum]